MNDPLFPPRRSAPPADQGASGFDRAEVAAQVKQLSTDFPPEVFRQIHAALLVDLTRIEAGLRAQDTELRRHGHVLVSLAGVVGATALSEAGHQIEATGDPALAAATASSVKSLIKYLETEANL